MGEKEITYSDRWYDSFASNMFPGLKKINEKELSKRCGLKLIKSEHLPGQQGGSVRFTIKMSGKDSHELENIESKSGIYEKRGYC